MKKIAKTVVLVMLFTLSQGCVSFKESIMNVQEKEQKTPGYEGVDEPPRKINVESLGPNSSTIFIPEPPPIPEIEQKKEGKRPSGYKEGEISIA